MITFDPLRKNLEKNGETVMIFGQRKIFSYDVCRALKEDKNVRLENLEKIAALKNLQINEICEYKP